MTSQKESYWAAKGPLWVIAFSLLTIACCLVLLVMRTVVGESPQASVNTNQVPLVTARIERDSPFRERLHADSGLRVSYDASSKVSSSLKRTDEILSGSESAEPPPVLVAVNSTRPVPRTPVVLYSARSDYQTGIKGTVRLKGDPPPEVSMDTTAAPCASDSARPGTTRFFITDTNGGLADTLVFISDGLAEQVFPVPDQPFEFVFTNCLIEPYVSAVLKNQQIIARDASGIGHSLKVRQTGIGKYLGADSSASLPKLSPELFVGISCDLHPWEFAYVSILKHPFFAVTDEHGEFSITNVPPGKYSVQAMHRSGQNRGFEQTTQNIKVSAKETVSVDFDLKAPSSSH